MKTTNEFPGRIKSELAGRIAAYNEIGFKEYAEAMEQYPISKQGKKASIAGYAEALFEMMKEDEVALPTPNGLTVISTEKGIPIMNRDTGGIDMYSQEDITIKRAPDLIDACLALSDKELLGIAIDTVKEPLSTKRPDILLKETEKLYLAGYKECAGKLADAFKEVIEDIKHI